VFVDHRRVDGLRQQPRARHVRRLAYHTVGCAPTSTVSVCTMTCTAGLTTAKRWNNCVAVAQSKHLRPLQIVPRPLLAGSRVFETPIRSLAAGRAVKFWCRESGFHQHQPSTCPTSQTTAASSRTAP
jgi:hypothetical protein